MKMEGFLMQELKPGYGKAQVDGGAIAYLVDGTGPPVVGTHPYWMPKAGYATLPGFTTITVWPRGFGDSSPARSNLDYGFWRLADDLDAVRRDLGLEKWVYWGGSFGGMTGQVYALKYQDTLAALILDGTAPSFHYIDDPASIWPQVRASSESAAYRTNPSPETQCAFFGLTSRLMGEWGLPKTILNQEHNPEALAECLRRINEFDVRSQLKGIRIPTLVLVGENDPSCPPSQAQIIADGIPGAILKIYPDVGHGVRFHNPPGLIELVQEFVGAAPAGA